MKYLIIILFFFSCQEKSKTESSESNIDSSSLIITDSTVMATDSAKPPFNINQVKTIEREAGRRLAIVGGNPTPIEDVGWQVLLSLDTVDLCGGSIIDRSWIITACHCVDFLEKSDKVTVYAGLFNKVTDKDAAQTRTVTDIIMHPNYGSNPNSQYENDVALLKLDRPLDFNSKVKSIRLATSEDRKSGLTNIGAQVRVSGWGLTTENGLPSDRLRSVDISIIDHEKAQAQYAKPALKSQVTDNMIAAGNLTRGQDACQGDSGGPLAVNFSTARPTLVGIVSYGIGCGRLDYSGIYTRVSNYQSWVEQTIHVNSAINQNTLKKEIRIARK